MQKHLFGNYLFRVTFWFQRIDGTRGMRTVKVIMDTPDENLAGAEAERLTEIKTYSHRRVEILPPYTDPWER